MEYNKSEQRLIDETNKAISELVYDKVDLQKAYNYYNGVRDAEQFRYLEENYGIGNPTSVEFTPLVKKHIDALIGEYLGFPILPKVSCKDEKTISNIFREKELTIESEVAKTLLNKLKNKLLEFLESNDESKLVDPYINDQLEKLKEDLSNSFVSKYEIAAQNVILYIIQSRQTDLLTKLRSLILDLLVTGYTYFRVKPTPDNHNVMVEIFSPLNVFPDKNPESPYIKDSYRVVVRKWLTKTQILNKYGKDLSKEERDMLEDIWKEDKYFENGQYVRSSASAVPTNGIEADKEVIIPGKPQSKVANYNYRLLPVYEVEWLETDKNFVMQRYETVRIGTDIYILKGKNENVQRSISNPTYCSLSVNGVYFDNRNDEPFSLMLACANLQDKYDLLHFYRDNLIANSGTTGDYVDVPLLPTYLGTSYDERLLKYIAYKKLGIALLDTSQEGRASTGSAPLNTIFNGYDNTVRADSIQAILIAIDSVEQTVSSITGVFRERLNGIEARDAVTNVKLGLTNSFIISKLWYQQMDLVVEEILADCLNEAKKVFKKGLTGTIILGDKQQKIFTALPDEFTLTDFDVHIISNSEIVKDLETIKLIIPDLARNGLGVDVLFDIVGSKSLTDAKLSAKQAVKKMKEEQNTIGQLLQLLQEAQLQMQQMLQQLLQAQLKVEQLDEQKLQIEQLKLQAETQINWFKAQTDRNFKENRALNDSRRTEIEEKQLYDGNPYNDAVKNI